MTFLTDLTQTWVQNTIKNGDPKAAAVDRGINGLHMLASCYADQTQQTGAENKSAELAFRSSYADNVTGVIFICYVCNC